MSKRTDKIKQQNPLSMEALTAPLKTTKRSNQYIALPPSMEEGEVGHPLLLYLIENDKLKLMDRKVGVRPYRIARLAETVPYLLRTCEKDQMVALELAMLTGSNVEAYNEIRSFCGGIHWGYWSETFLGAYENEGDDPIDAVQVHFLRLLSPPDMDFQVIDPPEGVTHWSTQIKDPDTKLRTMRTDHHGDLDATLQ